MTVSSQTSNETFYGNGVTTIWDLPFRFFDNGDIRAYRINTADQTQTPLVLGTDYTLTGAGLPEQFGTAPGKITTATAFATGNNLFVERVMDVEQLTDIINQGKFFPEVHEDVFDRLTMLIQQGVANNNRAIKVPPYDPIPQDLPSVPARADQLMGFNSLGDPIAVAPVNGSAADLAIRLASTADGNGDAMIGVKQPLTGSASITQHDKNAQTIHINDFPSTPANTWLSRAIDGTPDGWTLLLGTGPYIAKFSKIRSNITIRGSGMPYYNAGKTALVGGGTTVQGTFGLTGSNIHIENLGIDCGLTVCNAINSGAAMDALVLNDAARQPLFNCVVRDCIALCRDAASAAHNFLLEGCENSRFENLHARYGQWGVVMKTVNSTADGLYAYACSQAGFTFKSDTGVAGAVALKSSVTNVHIFADDYAAAVTGILIYAATSSIADFQLANFHIEGCASALKLLCDSRAANVNLLLGTTIANGTIRGATTFGIEAFGAMTGVLVSNVAVFGTASNKAIKVWSDCLGIEFNNVLASSPGVNALNVDLAGRFTINNVRSCVNDDYASPSGINLVPDSAATFKIGTYLGTIGFSGAQTWTPSFTGLAIVNGTGGVTITGSYVIIGKMIKFRVKIATTGTATTASTASTTFINNLPFTVLQNGTLRAVSGTVTQGGVGLVAEGGTNGYTPTWTAYNGTFTVEGEYFFQV